MSGGSFEYLYSKLDLEPLEWRTLNLLDNMANWLASPEQAQPEAAAELRELHKFLTDTRQKIEKRASNNRHIQSLVKEAEWWCSNDTGPEDFAAAWAKYREQKQ